MEAPCARLNAPPVDSATPPLKAWMKLVPAREIVPTLGSKEAIYSFAQIAFGDGLIASCAPGLIGMTAPRASRFFAVIIRNSP